MNKMLLLIMALACLFSGFAVVSATQVNEKEGVQSLGQIQEAVNPENTGPASVATSWINLSEAVDNNDSFINELSLGLIGEDPENSNAIDIANGFAATRAFARTRCAMMMIQVRSGASCSGHIIGRAMVKGKNYGGACVKAKKAAASGVPRGCQLKHCTPCTYE